ELNAGFARHAAGRDETDRAVELLLPRVVAADGADDRARDVGDVRRQPPGADRVLGYEPQQIRPREIALGRLVAARAGELRILGEQAFQRGDVARVDRGDRFIEFHSL